MAVPLLQWNVGSWVSSVRISHGGMFVASGSKDHLVRIWDVHTGTPVLRPLEGHTAVVRSVAWSHDDNRVASGSQDKTICIWDIRTGTLIGEPLKGHTSWVSSVAFSHDSTRIVSGSWDKTIRIWDVRTGTLICEPLREHIAVVYSVVFSPDGTHIASGSGDNLIHIWDARSGSPMGEPLRGHTAEVWSVAFSRDSTRIISGSADHTIRIWDAGTSTPIGEPLMGHTGYVNSVALSGDSTRIVSSSDDRTVRVWDALTGYPIGKPLCRHNGEVWSVTFTPDGSRIVSGSEDATICVWEVPHIPPSPNLVTSGMSLEEIFECLVQHGCPDISSSIVHGQYSSAPIANGGFGEVWRVTTSTGVSLAVKTLNFRTLLKGDNKAVKRAAREVHHWSKLQHPNVQKLLGIIVFRGQLGMVSPWVEHGNLSDYVGRHPGVARYPLCIQVAEGVSYLHRVGMVHGDLKANNVLVADNGVLKINDFDHAVLSDSTLRFSTTTQPGGGTLRWMAPELFQPEDDDDNDSEDTDEQTEQQPGNTRNMQTDVYALGMTMLEIFTGTVPYSEYKTDVGIYRAIHTKKPPRRPKVLLGSDGTTLRLWELLLKCWDHNPLARPDAPLVLAVLKGFSI